MHLSVPFDIAAISPRRGAEAATPADGIEVPAGFGAALAHAFGVAFRDRSADRSVGLAPLSEDASASEGDLDTSMLAEQPGGEPAMAPDVRNSAEDASRAPWPTFSSAAASLAPAQESAPVMPPQVAASAASPQESAPVIPPDVASGAPRPAATFAMPPEQGEPLVPPVQDAPLAPQHDGASVMPPSAATADDAAATTDHAAAPAGDTSAPAGDASVTEDRSPEATRSEGAETERRSTSGRVPDSIPGDASARSSDPGEPPSHRAADPARAPQQGAESEKLRTTATENVSARDAAPSAGEETSVEPAPVPEGGEPILAEPDRAAGQHEPAAAPGPSDEGLRDTGTAREEGGARRGSERPQAASGGSSEFYEGEADTQAEFYDQHTVSVSGQDGTETAPDEAAAGLDALPPDHAHGDVPERLEPAGDGLTFAPEQKSTATAISLTEAVPSSDRSRVPGSLAWMRSMLAQSSRTLDLAQGWKSIEVQLEDGLGTMTVRARRTEDGMAVSLAFSDSNLRTLAEANAYRLQDALRAEYETNVDLALMGDGSAGTPGERDPAGRGRALREPGASAGTVRQAHGEGSSVRLRPVLGTRNEWIG